MIQEDMAGLDITEWAAICDNAVSELDEPPIRRCPNCGRLAYEAPRGVIVCSNGCLSRLAGGNRKKMEVIEPRYKHDCDACCFVGQLGVSDIYLCPQGGHPTIVARHGDDGPEYLSGSKFWLDDLPLQLKLKETT